MPSTKLYYFQNEQEANEFLYGSANRYNNANISYEEDVFPQILQNFLESQHNDIPMHGEKFFQEKENIISGICRLYRSLPILKNYIDANYAFSPYMVLDLNPNNYIEKIKEYGQKGKILSLLANLKRPKNLCTEELIEILDFLNCIGSSVKIKSFLPTSIIPAFKRYFLSCFDELIGFFPNNELSNLLEKIEFKQEKCTAKKHHKNGYRIHPYGHGSSVLYEHLNISEQLFEKTISDESRLLHEVFFHDCHFSFTKANSETKSNIILHFENCVFENTFNLNELIRRSVEFKNCIFEGEINLNECFITADISFINCIFKEKSSLLLENVDFNKKINKLHFTLENCIINGIFSIQTQVFYPELHIRNVAFCKPFNIETEKFIHLPEISNICFPSLSSSQINTARKKLYAILLKSGYEEQANDLEILIKKEGTEKGDFDYYKYQKAKEEGMLDLAQAAKYLNMKRTSLNMKRAKDKKQITGTSLSFIQQGRKILYPLEALEAFRKNDLLKLKELRKKYPIPKK